MSTYRIYVDSRDRRSGSPTSFEYALPYSLAIQEQSLANIDVVVIPNSIQTVLEGVNDLIYIKGINNLNQVRYHTPRIAPGYYNVETLRVAIQTALSESSFWPGGTDGVFTVTYDERLAMYKLKAFAQRFGYQFTISSKHDQEVGANSAPPF